MKKTLVSFHVSHDDVRELRKCCNALGVSRPEMLRGLVRALVAGYIEVRHVGVECVGSTEASRQRLLKLHDQGERSSIPKIDG